MRLKLLSFFALLPAALAFPDSSPATAASNAIEECTGCSLLYSKLLQCQRLPMQPTSKPMWDCICIPNPNGWYGSMDSCRSCLAKNNNDFWTNTGYFITQLFTSCTNPGGNVYSNGESICATNAYWKMCVGLREGEDSWASQEDYRDKTFSNGTQLLNIKDPFSNGTQLLNIKDPSSKSPVTSTSSTSSTVEVPEKTTAGPLPTSTSAGQELAASTAVAGIDGSVEVLEIDSPKLDSGASLFSPHHILYFMSILSALVL